MNVAISVLYRASGGSLSHLVQLLRAWESSGVLAENRFVLFASRESGAALRESLPDEVLRTVEIRVWRASGRNLVARLWNEQVRLPRSLRDEGFDVVLCPANVVPLRSEIPSVVVLQNAAPFCESVTFRSLRGRWWLRFRILGFLASLSSRRAAAVIFLSDWFRELFVRQERLAPARAHVIPHAIPAPMEPRRQPAREESVGVREPYLLCVSHLNPYKNILELVDGFAGIAREHPSLQLVIAGMTNFPWYRTAIEARITARGLGGRVVLTGLIAPETVRALLSGCEAFVFPSVCENCPIALLEAMSFGKAIACSDAGVMPEVAGEAAVYFDAARSDSIADALRALLDDSALRERLGHAARVRAREWPDEAEIARRTFSVLEEASRGGAH